MPIPVIELFLCCLPTIIFPKADEGTLTPCQHTCCVQAGQLAQVASIDPWQVVQHEAALAAGDTGATLSAEGPTGVQLYKELEMIVEPELQGSTAGSDEESHVQQ